VPSRDSSLCLYGDSHLAALKHALDGDFVPTQGRQIEFFGAAGPAFRGLRLTDAGRVVPDKASLEALNLVTGGARTDLGGEDFGAFLFYGARLRSTEFIAEFLHRGRSEADFVSSAVRAQAMAKWLTSVRAVRIARVFAATGKAKVFFAPAPFEIEAQNQRYVKHFPEALNATAQERAQLNDEIAQALAGDGIVFVPQPEETIEKGCFTRHAFATPDAEATSDTRHMGPCYGAMVLGQVLGMMETAAAA